MKRCASAGWLLLSAGHTHKSQAQSTSKKSEEGSTRRLTGNTKRPDVYDRSIRRTGHTPYDNSAMPREPVAASSLDPMEDGKPTGPSVDDTAPASRARPSALAARPLR